MTSLDVEISGSTVILGGKYRITSSHGTPKTEFISFEGDEKLMKPWKCDGVTRIDFSVEGASRLTIKIEKI